MPWKFNPFTNNLTYYEKPTISVPPPGDYEVKNVYVDSDTGKLAVEFDDGA